MASRPGMRTMSRASSGLSWCSGKRRGLKEGGVLRGVTGMSRHSLELGESGLCPVTSTPPGLASALPRVSPS